MWKIKKTRLLITISILDSIRIFLSKPFFFGIKILKISAASAQLERLFSSWAFVHLDIRNRLTVERSMKLVDVYYSLKMNELYDEHYDNFIVHEKES